VAVLLRWIGALVRPLEHRGAGRLRLLARRAEFAHGRGAHPWPTFPADRIGLRSRASREATRPAVTIVVPFSGTEGEGRALSDALRGVRLRQGDAVIVVDNSARPVLQPLAEICSVRADAARSSYHARNVGFARAATPWVLFVDADCHPAPDILDAFFDEPVGERDGALVGAVLDRPGSSHLIGRFSARAHVIHQPRSLVDTFLPWGATANLLVRAAALREIGGFESVRSGGDVDACWRLQESGWALAWRPRAVVHHHHRTTLRGLLRQHRRYGSGLAWLGRCHPDADRAWPAMPRGVVRGLTRHLAAGRFEQLLDSVLDLLCTAAAGVGTLEHNRPGRGAGATEPLVATAAEVAPLDRVAALAALARRPSGFCALVRAGRSGFDGLRRLGLETALGRLRER
ncbi:MAG: glycosyltransferase, partial [Solirubrobacterales bacterium]|nr:glycosyltransferase [Solirubrobacterales bacterium]